jgi:arylformamidase
MVDFEAEYDNRGRVPEHPAILAGWARDAAAFRAERGERAELDIAYGPGERQRLDLFHPDEASADAPPILFIHGGYWQALDKASFSHMASGAVAHGAAVAVMGYTLCPATTVAAIVDEARAAATLLARRFARAVTVAGHSAGGHLAAALLASDWAALRGELGFAPVAAGMPISGLFDLVPLIRTTVNAKLGLDEAEARRLSPMEWAAPAGARLVAVVGGEESSEYLRQTRELVRRWGEAGVAARAVELPGANHFTVIGPLADRDSDLTRGLIALARG